MVDAKRALSSCTFARGRCVVPFECFDKIKCCVVRILFVMGRESGYGERELGLGGEIAMVLFLF